VLSMAIGFGVWFFWGDSVDELIAQMDPSKFVVALVLLSLGLPTVAMRWRSLLAPEEKTRANPLFMTALLMVGHLLNTAVPGPVGEFVSSWMVHKRYKVDLGNALSALLVSRVLGLLSAFLIACVVFWLAPFDVAPEYIERLWLVSLLLGVLGGVVSLVVLFPTHPRRLLQYMRQFVLFQRPFFQRLFDMADRLLGSFLDTTKRGFWAYGEAFFWCVLGHSMVAMGIWYTVLALGYDVGWTAIFFTYSSSIIFSLVMFMFPGSTFGFDALFSGILHMTGGIPLAVAILVASVIRLHQSLIAVIGGAMMLFSSKELVEEAMVFGRSYVKSEGVQYVEDKDLLEEEGVEGIEDAEDAEGIEGS
jgi:hypothetical protein